MSSRRCPAAVSICYKSSDPWHWFIDHSLLARGQGAVWKHCSNLSAFLLKTLRIKALHWWSTCKVLGRTGAVLVSAVSNWTVPTIDWILLNSFCYCAARHKQLQQEGKCLGLLMLICCKSSSRKTRCQKDYPELKGTWFPHQWLIELPFILYAWVLQRLCLEIL
jgi:hypothetical protein